MNLWDHLGELRRRLLICLYVLVVGTVAGAFAVNPVIAWLAQPVGALVFVHPTEAFPAQVKIAVVIVFLVTNRLVSYRLLLLLATIFNPVPEVFTQLLLACAAIALFEFSLFLVRWEIRKR